MATTLARPLAARRTRAAVIDCDIHNGLPARSVLTPYLSARWQRHHEVFGGRHHSGGSYPRANPAAARTDAWPPNGQPPGSDLPFLRQQLLDEWGIEIGILNTLVGAAEQSNLDYAAALTRALNDWIAAEWLDPEPRLRASIIVPYEDGALAAEEIHRRARDPRFVQVLGYIRTAEPLGRRKYWPMYEAAVEHGLPIGFHFGGHGGGPITGAGWPSFYVEDHAGMSMAFQSQVISFICEGVFERFPTLKLVLIEGGFAWLPSLMWRLDRLYPRLKEENPALTQLPSELIRQHVWITTQPMEEPTEPKQFHELLGQLDMNDRLMFATDYPHWDFDAPDQALPVRLAPELEAAIMAENARTLYRLPVAAPA